MASHNNQWSLSEGPVGITIVPPRIGKDLIQNDILFYFEKSLLITRKHLGQDSMGLSVKKKRKKNSDVSNVVPVIISVTVTLFYMLLWKLWRFSQFWGKCELDGIIHLFFIGSPLWECNVKAGIVLHVATCTAIPRVWMWMLKLSDTMDSLHCFIRGLSTFSVSHRTRCDEQVYWIRQIRRVEREFQIHKEG